ARRLPSMTVLAPRARALVMSPEYLIPPSATIGTSGAAAAFKYVNIALALRTPTPATTRVVQIEPGPMPTLTASAPASSRAVVASAVAALPAMSGRAAEGLFG